MPVANPLAQCTTAPQVGCLDNLGNFTAFATPGLYTYTQTGAGLTPYGPIPIPASFGGGTITGTATNTQIAYGTAANQIGSSPNLTWNSVNNTITVQNPAALDGWVLQNLTPATNVLAQFSPILRLRGQSWNGATSINDDCFLQNQPINGVNAGRFLQLSCNPSNNTQFSATLISFAINALSVTQVNASLNVSLLAGLANGGGNVSSNSLILQSQYWNGAASIPGNTSFQDIIGSGATPTTTTTISNSGAFNWAGISLLGAFKSSVSVTAPTHFAGTDNSVAGFFQAANSAANAHTIWGSAATTSNTILGFATAPTTNHVAGCTTTGTVCTLTDLGIPQVECGTIAANAACANTVTANPHCVSGLATLGGGTSTITGISPAFTSATSYTVVTNDNTTITNASKGVPASGSTITFTGTGTDVLNFVACGG
jgi:hypothetical protein